MTELARDHIRHSVCAIINPANLQILMPEVSPGGRVSSTIRNSKSVTRLANYLVSQLEKYVGKGKSIRMTQLLYNSEHTFDLTCKIYLKLGVVLVPLLTPIPG